MVFLAVEHLLVLILSFHLKSVFPNGNLNTACQLTNQTFVFDICKTPPKLTLPVCAGFCSTISQWSFRSKEFLPRINACTVKAYRTEQFVCPDSTHTAVSLLIPLSCSCSRLSCSLHTTTSKRYSK